MTFTPIVVGSGLGAYTLLNQTRDRQQVAFNNSPQIARDTAYFEQNVTNVASSDDLVNDRTMLRVALGAFGLDGDIDNRIFIKQVLDSDLTDSSSLANRLSDSRYQALAEAFGFNSPNGPQLSSTSSLGARLDSVQSAEELLSSRSLLREALNRFDLGADENNTFFLQRVLNSDTTDPSSFVNQLDQQKYIDFAEAFNFAAQTEADTKVEGFVQAFEGKFDALQSADDLLADPVALTAAVDLFELQNDDPILLKQVLTADPTDENSLVNLMDDKRYLAFSEAFRFGWPDINALNTVQFIDNAVLRADALDQFDVSDPGDDTLRDLLNSDLGDPGSVANQAENSAYLEFVTAFQTGWPEQSTKAEAFIGAVTDKIDTFTTAAAVVFDLDVFTATLDLFGQQDRNADFLFLQKILDSDLSNPASNAAQHPDKRLGAMANAFGINPGEVGRSYPEGFAQDLINLYTDRRFEIGVGDSNPDMRLALSLNRELSTVINAGGTVDGKWFGVLASPPLREIFETTLRLPDGFVNLDLDRQVAEMKSRTDSLFGTTDIADFAQTELMDDLRDRFLVASSLTPQATSAGAASAALALLQGG